jgi:hypothetical protein
MALTGGLANLDVGERLDSDRSLEERPVLAALAGAVQNT